MASADSRTATFTLRPSVSVRVSMIRAPPVADCSSTLKISSARTSNVSPPIRCKQSLGLCSPIALVLRTITAASPVPSVMLHTVVTWINGEGADRATGDRQCCASGDDRLSAQCPASPKIITTRAASRYDAWSAGAAPVAHMGNIGRSTSARRSAIGEKMLKGGRMPCSEPAGQPKPRPRFDNRHSRCQRKRPAAANPSNVGEIHHVPTTARRKSSRGTCSRSALR